MVKFVPIHAKRMTVDFEIILMNLLLIVVFHVFIL